MTMEVFDMIVYTIGLVVGIAGNTWAIIRYLINRQDKAINDLYQRMNQRDDAVSNEMRQIRASSVSKEDYHRDSDRLYSEIKGTRDEVSSMSRGISQLLLTLSHNGRER